jgi:uncharacterized protein (TIGR02757 family)
VSPSRRSDEAGSPVLKSALDSLYRAFNYPESAADPIQIVRRYERLDDREIVAFVASGLAFGRVASVLASIEAICKVMGPAPASFVRTFDPRAHGAPLQPLVHRWTRGDDFVALLWMLRRLLDEHGSLERAFAAGNDPAAVDVAAGIEAFSSRARAIDLGVVYGPPRRSRRSAPPGAFYFWSRPSTGSACKRINLFLRWMVRRDAIDPGGWTDVAPRQLIVPLDTHTIRTGRCLRLTRRATPGWAMAVEITDALRALDSDDPVRYDFALCHLSMMGACGYGSRQGSTQCPLRDVCKPARR